MALSRFFIHRSIKSKNILSSCSVFNLQNQRLSYEQPPIKEENNFRTKHLWRVGIGLCLFGCSYYLIKNEYLYVVSATTEKSKATIKGLPEYTLDEVADHASKEDGIWVTYQRGVYDITKFVEEHPGGSEKILMAAGGSLEPFWSMYSVHQQPSILAILEQFRIGNLSEADAKEVAKDVSDPYLNDPKRHPILHPSSLKPYNAEPPPSILVDSYVTPNDLFYVRNHLPVPKVEVSTYKLKVYDANMKETSFSLEDIKTKFPKVTVTATVMCAGNRRGEMVKVKPVKGLSWGHAAIGNATWSGARLHEVLRSLGIDETSPNIEHVQFEGLDTDGVSVFYGASIPIEKALNPAGDVILAYEMNGEPIPRDHGYPLRVIVPGIVGARNVKWLGKIIVSKNESESHWQQNDYKGFSPSTDWDTVDFKTAPAIQELPVISAICDPSNSETISVKNGKITVRGYAWSGGGSKIVRVDVTGDQGKTWQVAKLIDEEADARPYRHWGWTLWTAEIPVSSGSKQVELWAKAVDSNYNTQPETFENIWNLRGVLSNAYHRIKVNLKYA
ncbi:unnamed protein product [Bemisia tabaci]|uniref:Sulfite oxidase n=1 Tax=Bemisia tabaci TaxID=7038 RepID=A0A9P0F2L5_BEMTA|nr:unnamed protein product [Bemisia tabaci]